MIVPLIAEYASLLLVSFYPLYHWTDAQIRVHTFLCVLGLLLWRCL